MQSFRCACFNGVEERMKKKEREKESKTLPNCSLWTKFNWFRIWLSFASAIYLSGIPAKKWRCRRKTLSCHLFAESAKDSSRTFFFRLTFHIFSPSFCVYACRPGRKRISPSTLFVDEKLISTWDSQLGHISKLFFAYSRNEELKKWNCDLACANSMFSIQHFRLDASELKLNWAYFWAITFRIRCQISI